MLELKVHFHCSRNNKDMKSCCYIIKCEERKEQQTKHKTTAAGGLFTLHTDWHLLLFLFEHRFVINQSGHVASAVTAEIALIWTTPLGQTWSLTLMPFSATETFHPPFFTPFIDFKIKRQTTPETFKRTQFLSSQTKGADQVFVWTLTCSSSAQILGQPAETGLTSPRPTVLNNLCLVKSVWAHH